MSMHVLTLMTILCVFVCVNEWSIDGAWREGIFGLHAVLHKFVFACMLDAMEHSDYEYL